MNNRKTNNRTISLKTDKINGFITQTSLRISENLLTWLLTDTGYAQNGRADKNSYPQDSRADKKSYPHNSPKISSQLWLTFALKK